MKCPHLAWPERAPSLTFVRSRDGLGDASADRNRNTSAVELCRESSEDSRRFPTPRPCAFGEWKAKTGGYNQSLLPGKYSTNLRGWRRSCRTRVLRPFPCTGRPSKSSQEYHTFEAREAHGRIDLDSRHQT